MRTLVPLAALLLSTAAAPVPSPVTPPVRPNIVVLLADDWGLTDVGAFGGEMRTPNLDMLAQKGVRFSNFHVAGSCSPTRAMLQTGVSSHRAGLGNMPETIPPQHQGRRGYDAVLNNRVTGFANQLQAAGYRTYFTGKWHLGEAEYAMPTSHGFDGEPQPALPAAGGASGGPAHHRLAFDRGRTPCYGFSFGRGSNG
jgi:arylsulfatase/uncharacterized sulfatase